MERYVAESATAVSGTGTTTISLTDRTLVRLSLDGSGNIDLEAGSEDGQYRILLVEALTPTCTQKLENTATVKLNDRAWLPEETGEALGLMWNATLSKWCEMWRSLQYDSTSGIYVKNETGSTIVRGSVVFISGATGNNPLITLADYTTEQFSARTIGLVHDDIANNAFGHVISSGLVENVNTGGMTSGQSLYLGASGAFTNVKPVAPNHMVKVGNVIRASATVGSVQVWISNGFELDELHDVQITSVAKGDIVVRNGSNLWVNLPVGTNTHVLTADSTTATGVKWAAGGGGGSPAIGGTITGGTAGSVLFVDPAATIAQDNANLFYDNANNRLGIGTNTPATALHVIGEARSLNFSDNNGNYNVNLGNGNNEGRGLVAGYSGGSYGGIGYNIRHTTTGSTYISPLADTSNYIQFSQGFQFLGDAGTTAGRTTSFTELMRITNTGNVGIGTTSPTSTLSVGASSEFQVNSTGNIVRINNIPYSFPAAQGGASTVLQNNGSGTLTWAAAGGGGGLSEPEVMARAAWRMW